MAPEAAEGAQADAKQQAAELGPAGPGPRRPLLSYILFGIEEGSDAALKSRVSWLMFFRTVIITVLLAATVGLRAGSGQSLLGTVTVTLYLVCGLSYASVLFGALWMRSRRGRNQTGLVRLAYVQLVGDSLVASVLVLATGGYDSAFVVLYSLTILNAAAVLGRQASLVLAGFNSLSFFALLALQLSATLTGLGLEEPSWTAAFPSLVANVLAFFLVAVLASALTEQLRRTAESLSEAREDLIEAKIIHETVLESLPSGVLTVGDDGRVTFVNRAGSEILGLDTQALVGRHVGDVVPSMPTHEEQTRFEVVRKASEPATDRQVLGGSVAALEHGGRGRVVVFQDLTELRTLQDDLSRADRLKTLGRFAAGIAHELRNPLAAMIGCLQLMKGDATIEGLSDEGQRMLGIIERESTRLESLVGEFLTYARPASPSPRPVDVGVVIERCAGASAQAAELQDTQAPEFEIRTDMQDEALMAQCDEGQFEQILWNLVGNAGQAATGQMGQTSGPGLVVISAAPAGEQIEIHVDDNGPGVAEANRAHVFEPFFTTRAGGTGLGLATSHQLAVAQGGDLVVRESPLGGARFTLRLPRSKPIALPAPGDSTTSLVATPSGADDPREARRG